MMEIMRFNPQICLVHRVMLETVRTKFTNAEVIHRLMKEQKQCFGALLETKLQKVKRLKLEKKGLVCSKIAKPEVNSELNWMLKHSKTRLVRMNPIPIVELSEPDAISKKVYLKKSSEEHQRASIDAAQGVLNKLQDVAPLGISKKVTRKLVVVQKKILQKSPSDVTSKITIQKDKKSIVLPTDRVTEKIDATPLFYEKEEKWAHIRRGGEILSLSRTEDKDSLMYPSVTRILNATMSAKALKMLENWMARMIGMLGEEGFAQYKADLLENGKLWHAAIESTLRKEPVEVPPHLKPCYDSVKSVLDDLQDVRAIESHVVHHDLGYRGVIDCVASYRENVCLIDWKKSDKAKKFLSSTYDAPLQIASYIGALNSDKNYPFQIKSGLLVIAYSLGDKPTLHPIDETALQYYWKQWLERLKIYYTMQNT